MTPVSALLDDLQRRLRESAGRVLVVAIDGRSGAGKSTLADELAQHLPSTTVRMDDFYRDEPESARLLHDAEAGVARYFDWERLRDEAIEPLRRGEAARFHPFDWQRGSGMGPTVTVPPAPVVLVEGVYSARPELGELVDVTVLAVADDEVRRRRRALRHDPHPWMARWDAAEDLYFGRLQPCDYVVECGIGRSGPE